MQQKTFFKKSGIPYNSKLAFPLKSLPLDPEIRRFLNYIQIHGLITRRKKGRMPSKRSIAGFEEQLRRFRVFTGKPWNEVTPEDVYGYADWLFEKGYSQRTIGHGLYTLQNVFNYLVETKRMGDASRKDNLGRYLNNPCVYVSKPKGEDKEIEPVTDEEFARLLEAAGKTKKSLMNVIYLRVLRETWLRKSQVLSIRYGNIDFDKGCLRFKENPKAEKKMRVAPLSDVTLGLIRKLMLHRLTKGENGNDRLFTFGPESAIYRLKKWAKGAGINKNIYPHLFRHTGASEYYKETKDQIGLVELGGWSVNSAVWRRYVHTNEDDVVKLGRDYLNYKFKNSKI